MLVVDDFRRAFSIAGMSDNSSVPNIAAMRASTLPTRRSLPHWVNRNRQMVLFEPNPSSVSKAACRTASERSFIPALATSLAASTSGKSAKRRIASIRGGISLEWS